MNPRFLQLSLSLSILYPSFPPLPSSSTQRSDIPVRIAGGKQDVNGAKVQSSVLTSHTSAPRKFIRFAGVRIRNLIKRRRRYSRVYSRERSYYFPEINLTSWRAPPVQIASPCNNLEPSFRQFSFFLLYPSRFRFEIHLFIFEEKIFTRIVAWLNFEIWKWEETNILVFRLLLYEYFKRKVNVLVISYCIVSEKRRYDKVGINQTGYY